MPSITGPCFYVQVEGGQGGVAEEEEGLIEEVVIRKGVNLETDNV